MNFEIVQKALVDSIPIVEAVSAPSSLAIELVEDSNMTLIGLLNYERLHMIGKQGGPTHRRHMVSRTICGAGQRFENTESLKGGKSLGGYRR